MLQLESHIDNQLSVCLFSASLILSARLTVHYHCESVLYLAWWPTYSSCQMQLMSQHPEEGMTFESWLHKLVPSYSTTG